MNGAATDGVQSPPVQLPQETPAPDLSAALLAADIQEPDEATAAAVQAQLGRRVGRLAELAGWLAATQGRTPPTAPRRARCVIVGEVAPAIATLADSMEVGVRELSPTGAAGAALQAGIAAADDEVDADADLVVLVADAAETDPAPAALVSLLSGVEPVALLSRGAAAGDSKTWSRRAGQIRDLRRVAVPFRARHDQLLDALESPALAATAGFLLRATARRTPVLLAGTTAVAAAVFGCDLVAAAAEWWQVADAAPDPAHARGCQELCRQPLLALGIEQPSGVAGLLTLPILRAAAAGCA